jgi:hypothetical protein
MSAMSECYKLSGFCVSPSHSNVANDDPPKAGELFGEAALALAVPLVLAIVVSFVLPIAGFAVP